MSSCGVSAPSKEAIDVSMKTVQRSPRSAGAREARAISPNFSSGISILAACSSIKEPVPAAQILFIMKSTTSPSLREIYLESCPPISKTVSASGFQNDAHFAWAVISSFMLSAPIIRPIRVRPEPVTPTDWKVIFPYFSWIAASPFRTAFSGFPAVRRY